MKKSIIIVKIGTVTEKGNVTLTVQYKKGLVKQTLYVLSDEESTKELTEGQDISDMIPDDFTVRQSELTGINGEVIKTKWIELV